MRPREDQFWAGVALGLRLVLVAAHLLFGGVAILRANSPLLFQVYRTFDDLVPF